MFFLMCLSSLSVAEKRFLVPGGEIYFVSCSQSGGSSKQLYDFYEAELLWSIRPYFGPNNLTVAEKVDLALARIKELSPLRYERFKLRADNFMRFHYFSPNVYFPTPPSEPLVLLNDCQAQVMAAMTYNETNRVSKFIINRTRWNQLSKDHQAGFIVHALIFEEAYIEHGHEDSRHTRNFTVELAANRFQTDSHRKFIEKLIHLDIGLIEWDHLVFKQMELDPYSSLLRGTLLGTQSYSLMNQDVQLFGEVTYKTNRPQRLHLVKDHLLQFGQAGPYWVKGGAEYPVTFVSDSELEFFYKAREGMQKCQFFVDTETINCLNI